MVTDALRLILETTRSLLITLSFQFSRSDLIPSTILLRSNHDPGDPAYHTDRRWIRNFILSFAYLISNIALVTVYKLSENILGKKAVLREQLVGICNSVKLTTRTYLSNMACCSRVVPWTTPYMCTALRHAVSISTHINIVATHPIVTKDFLTSIRVYLISLRRQQIGKW